MRFSKLKEARYLYVDNTYRYRAIMKIVFLSSEKFQSWLYQDEILSEILSREFINDYTKEELANDLTKLVEWGNLNRVQDKSRAVSYEDFIAKQFKYQISEKGLHIERLLIQLEQVDVRNDNIQPALLARISDQIALIPKLLNDENDEELYRLWILLKEDFKNLRKNYQEFVRDWQSPKTEELLKIDTFYEYKENMFKYLEDFIMNLQENKDTVSEAFNSLSQPEVRNLFIKVSTYEAEQFSLKPEKMNQSESYIENMNQFDGFKRFFVEKGNDVSEVDTIISLAKEMIVKVTKYANAIASLNHIFSNRKEEYKWAIRLISSEDNLELIKKYAVTIFGVDNIRHFQSDKIEDNSSTSVSVYNQVNEEVILRERRRGPITKKPRKSTKLYTMERAEQKKMQDEKEKRVRDEVMKFVDREQISLSDCETITPIVRKELLRWIDKCMASKDYVAGTKYGFNVKIMDFKTTERTKIRSIDGVIDMPAFELKFIKKGKAL